jgi:membrane-bound serine protease (ClpP class)
MFRTRLRIFFLVWMVIPLATGLGGSLVAAVSPTTVEILTVDGTIVPVVVDYIDRGITRAEEIDATVLIIELNTPGGLLDSTRKIVERILNATVPVVVYVSPSGGRAASAGAFITLASHIAAMTPGTHIGAASPVAIGEEMPDEAQRKIIEDTAAWMRSIAEQRGRDVHYAELMVTEAKSYTYSEALERNLIDLQAADLTSLISQINGWNVTLVGDEEVIIDTTEYVVARNEMNTVERFLHTISHPNIAYILLTLATLGLMIELFNPGLIFPGVVGGISLLLAFYSLGVLDAYWGGIALILLAAGLFIAEYFVTGFGLLTAGGVISLIMGSLILFTYTPGIGVVDWRLIAGVTISFTAFAIFVIGTIARGQRRPKSTGVDGMIGTIAIAKTSLDPTGTVLAHGELWTATSEGDNVAPGEEVIIDKVEGLKLWVKKIKGIEK